MKTCSLRTLLRHACCSFFLAAFALAAPGVRGARRRAVQQVRRRRPPRTSTRASRRTRSRRSTRRRPSRRCASLTDAFDVHPGVRGLDVRQRDRRRQRRRGVRQHRTRRRHRRVLRPGPLRRAGQRVARTAGARSSSSIPTRPTAPARRTRRARSTPRRWSPIRSPAASRRCRAPSSPAATTRSPAPRSSRGGRSRTRSASPIPAIAFRITGPACVVQLAIAPNYPSSTPRAPISGRFPSRVEERVRFRRRRSARRRSDSIREAIPPMSRRCRNGACC